MALHVRGPGSDSVSGAKLGLYGTIGTAVIGAAATIIVEVLSQNARPVSAGPPTTAVTPAAVTITPTASQKSDSGSVHRVVIGETGDITVSGSSDPDVTRMYVLIGPNPSGEFWTGYANVSDQQWQADVHTDPPWQNYPIEVLPGYQRPSDDTTKPNAFKFAVQGTEPTTPPPPPPDEILKCAQKRGSSCFNGPAFGPPSVYRSDQ